MIYMLGLGFYSLVVQWLGPAWAAPVNGTTPIIAVWLGTIVFIVFTVLAIIWIFDVTWTTPVISTIKVITVAWLALILVIVSLKFGGDVFR